MTYLHFETDPNKRLFGLYSQTFQKPVAFPFPAANSQILHQNWYSLAPGDDSLWGKRENNNKTKTPNKQKPHDWVQREWICASPSPLTEVAEWNWVSVLCWRLPAWFSRELLHSLYFKFLTSKIGKYLSHIWKVKMKVIVRNLGFLK